MAVQDLKETALCGMRIRYTVDSCTDMVTYTDINGRGDNNLQKACEHCSWRGICKPTAMSHEKALAELEKVKEILKKEEQQTWKLYQAELAANGGHDGTTAGYGYRQQHTAILNVMEELGITEER
ncbi:MAG TPA: hypothetical protein DCE48_04930 [Lachnospiraceae bacterium]|nr:hypothetical protein [Lachnospiraceae bacterium]